MKTIIFIHIVLFIVLTSCTYSTYPKYKTSSYPKTNPDTILIYPKEINQDYEIIGIVGVDVKGDGDAVIEQIKKIASKHGADAIIHFKLNQLDSSTNITGGSGVAIKLFQNANVKYSLR